MCLDQATFEFMARVCTSIIPASWYMSHLTYVFLKSRTGSSV